MPRVRRSRARRLAMLPVAILTVAVECAAPEAHAIVAILHSGDPGPCEVTIYWDDTWTGCDSVRPDSERGTLVEAAVQNAIAVMRAWRRRRPESIVPESPDPSAQARAAAMGYAKFAELLRPAMAVTSSVDSMAVSISSDSIGESEAKLRSRYWLARSVRDGYGPISRVVGRVDYREAWVRSGDRWSLRDIERVDGFEWTLGTDPGAESAFPARMGLRMTMVDIGRRKERATVEEPIARTEGDERSVAHEAVPVVAPPPAYPESARQAEIRGTVVVIALVGADGRVEDAEIVEGVVGLNEAALDAVRRWVFQPALDREGRPIGAWTRVEVTFR